MRPLIDTFPVNGHFLSMYVPSIAWQKHTKRNYKVYAIQFANINSSNDKMQLSENYVLIMAISRPSYTFIILTE